MRTGHRAALVLMVAVAILMASSAWAQVGGVVLAGDEGITTAFEYDRGALFRAGVISRQGGSEFDWMASIGKRFGVGEVLTADAALDLEAMHPGLRETNPNEPVDFRARVGVGWRVTDAAALLWEFSRSFHNETTEGRWMWGLRYRF